MGKQKSYIMVGSVFLAFILLMLLVTIITSNVKDTKITFDSDTYTVEISGIGFVTYKKSGVEFDEILEIIRSLYLLSSSLLE